MSDPLNPSEVGALQLPEFAEGIPVIDGARLYIATHGNLLEDVDSMLHVVDIADPSALTLLGSMSLTGPTAEAGRITASGDRVFMEINAGAAAVDVSDPTAPVMTGVYDLADAFPDLVASANLRVNDIAISGEHGVIVVFANDEDQEHRLEVVDLACP